MPKYLLNIDRKVTVWCNEERILLFDGSIKELQDIINKHEGDIDAVPEVEVIDSNWEYIAETEEPMSVGDNDGCAVFEIKELTEEN